MRALYWLRRDLRLSDNRILAEAYSRSDEIAAIYIVDPGMLRQRGIDLSHRIFSLVFDALRELNRRIRVHVFMGKTRDVMDELLSKHGFDFLYTASPLSWSEQELAKQVREICLKRGVTYREVLDNVLSNPFQLDPGPNFTSIYRKWLEKIDTKIAPEVPADKFIGLDEPDVEEFARKQGAGMLGEDFLRASWGRERLRSFDFSRYSRLKDYPCEDGTSKLSPFLSLGILSVREVYRAVKRQSREYVRQLAWRE
ncbi:MAG: deoxyribodipyrimidine photo-lyase, partial [Thermofilaceae archaeon]